MTENPKEEPVGSALVKRPEISALAMSAAEATSKLAAIRSFQAVVKKTLIKGHDYGVIPGTPKPTLLKPGAEKIAKLLNLSDEYEIVAEERWSRDDPFFYYRTKAILKDIETGSLVSTGIGSCNSMEVKYAWRWVPERDLPKGVDKESLPTREGKREAFEFEFAIQKRETTGKYGKPAAYWDAFEKAIKDGTAIKETRKFKTSGKEGAGYKLPGGQAEFRIPNDGIFDQANTILKMSKKRALVDAALSVGRLSDLFTQDIEEMDGFEAMEEAPAEEKPNGTPPPADEPPVFDPAEGQADASELTASQEIVIGLMSEVAEKKSLGIEEIKDKIRLGIKKANPGVPVPKRIPEDLTDLQCGPVATFLTNWAKEQRGGGGKK